MARQLEADLAGALQVAKSDVRCLSLSTSTAAVLVGIHDRQSSPAERERLRELLERQAADASSPLLTGAVSKGISELRVTLVPSAEHQMGAWT